jgi:hypothetical protein
VLGTLNALGSFNVVLSSVLISVATLYPGLSIQLTFGRIGMLDLCSFTVLCICGTRGFILMYFFLFSRLLLLFMLVRMLSCCLLLMPCGSFSKLLCGSLPQCNERYPIGAHNGSSNAHWVARRLAAARGKSIKMRSPGTAVTQKTKSHYY